MLTTCRPCALCPPCYPPRLRAWCYRHTSCWQISKSLELLEQIGGIDANEDLKPLGYHLAALPTDVRIGKLLIFGALLRCVEPILSIAAVLSTRSPFLNLQSREPDERHGIELARKRVSVLCGKSDHMVFAKTFALFREAKDKTNREQLTREGLAGGLPFAGFW